MREGRLLIPWIIRGKSINLKVGEGGREVVQWLCNITKGEIIDERWEMVQRMCELLKNGEVGERGREVVHWLVEISPKSCKGKEEGGPQGD
jgi:hypothetical protein